MRDVEACQLQADGNVSMIISSRDSNTGNFSAAAFLLDEDPAALEGTTVAVNVNPANLTSVPWTSATPITPSGGVMQRNGVRWDQFLGFAPPATSGTTSLAIPPGTDRMDFIFAAKSGSSTICVDHITGVVPSSIGVSIPDLAVETLSRNGNTISWSFTGTDTGVLDLLFGGFGYIDDSDNSIQWRYLVTPEATSFTLPGLPADLASLTPPAVIPPGKEFFYVEAVGLDNVEGFDAYVTAVEPFMGNFRDFLLGGTTTRAIFLQRQEFR